MPTLVIAGIALAALGLLLTNSALIAWFIIRKRNKGLTHANTRKFYINVASVELYIFCIYVHCEHIRWCKVVLARDLHDTVSTLSLSLSRSFAPILL